MLSMEVRASSGGAALAKTTYGWNAYRRSAVGGCGSAEAGWCTVPTSSNIYNNAYRTLWVRLDTTSAWTSNVGQLSKRFYQSGSQSNLQFGNVTEAQELSHSEGPLALATWESRVSSGLLGLCV